MQGRMLRIYYYALPTEIIFGWNTSVFEVYAAFSPTTSKNSATTGMNALLRYIRKEEEKLFVTNAPTF